MGYLFGCKGLIFLDNMSYKLGDTEDEIYYHKLVKVIKERKEHFSTLNPISKQLNPGFAGTQFNWLVLYTRINSDFPDWFKTEGEFRETPLPIQSKPEFGQQGRKGKDNFDDVKLEISADNIGHALDEAFVSVNKGKKEKLDIDSRFIEGLHSLAEAVKEDKLDGWVFNKDLDRTCSDSPDKLKYEIIKAFRKITGIGKRAKGIISIKHGSAKRLNIPRKNISFKRIS